MPGFSSVDAIVNAISVDNRLQRLQLQKVLPSTNVANVWHTCWKATGLPAAGADPTTGLGGAVVTTSATTGAMPFTNATGGRTMHVLGLSGVSMTAGGVFYLVDRIAHCNLARNEASGSLSPVLDGTSRLAAGEGGQLVMEVTTALGTSVTARTFDYTDQGAAASTTPSISDVASAVVGRVPYAASAGGLFVPLAAGDSGVRTVTATTLGATGTATGLYNLALVRPLAIGLVPTVSVGMELDAVVALPNLPRIFDSSCLMLYFVSASVSATYMWQLELRIAEN